MSQTKSVNSEKEYDFLVMIGRFQPFHNGHLQTLIEAFTKAKEVIILLGSSESARNIKNPFSDWEREDMIYESAKNAGLDTGYLHIVGIPDDSYNINRWIESVQTAVNNRTSVKDNPKVKLIGHIKDESSFYLEKFPQWGDHIEVGSLHEGINASDIRDLYFQKAHEDFARFEFSFRDSMPKASLKFLKAFTNTPEFLELREEYEFIKRYKASWKFAPYPPTFVTTDAIVVKNGHVLLIERGDCPGKGLWALPGGFLEQGETTYASILRELREETKLKVPTPVLDHAHSKGSTKVFDHPGRSLRGRTITHAFLFNLDDSDLTKGLPTVKGSSDAKKAFWLPFSEITTMRDKFFEDHYHIISHFLNK